MTYSSTRMIKLSLPSLASLLVFALWTSSPAFSDPFQCSFKEVSPGVWVGIREDSPRFPVMGNTTFVVSDSDVVVFDGGGVSRMSEIVIKKIRSVTDKLVTHVVVSHWHGDHNLGIHRFLEEFPNTQVVGHSFTRAAMMGGPMEYVGRYPEFVLNFKPQIEKLLEKGLNKDGSPVPEFMLARYKQMVLDADLIHEEYNRVKITPPAITFDDKLVIHSGDRQIQLIYLGDGNTAGDIVMWLPKEKIVATGDIVVLPTPYGFNVPPRAWVETMRNIKALKYSILIPGHGEIQRDAVYVDLLIETAESIAEHRDELLARGVSQEDAAARLSYANVEEIFTGGDEYLADRFNEWFAGPFQKAAFKVLKGEPMVSLKPRPAPKSDG